MKVKCLAQEDNTMSPARARTWSGRSGVKCTNHKGATMPPQSAQMATRKFGLKIFKLKSIRKGYAQFLNGPNFLHRAVLTVNRELSPHTISYRTKGTSSR